MQFGNGDIVKAGYLHKRSKFLRQWKQRWVTLNAGGYLCIFESEQAASSSHNRSLDKIFLPTQFLRIKHANDLEVDPPSGISRSGLLSVETRNEGALIFCAANQDETAVWAMILEEAGRSQPRTASESPRRSHHQPEQHHVYYGGGRHGGAGYYYNSPYFDVPAYRERHHSSSGGPTRQLAWDENGRALAGQTVIVHPNGTQTVYVGPANHVPFCSYHGCSCRHCDCRYGDAAALGLMMGSAMMLSPFMWGPCLW